MFLYIEYYALLLRSIFDCHSKLIHQIEKNKQTENKQKVHLIRIKMDIWIRKDILLLNNGLYSLI